MTRCPNCGNYGITKYDTHCSFCGYDLGSKYVGLPERWFAKNLFDESKGVIQKSFPSERKVEVKSREIKHKTINIYCPKCGHSSLMFNYESRLFECLNIDCNKRAYTIVGIIGYDNFVEAKMGIVDKIIKLVLPDYDPDKKMVGECKSEDIRELIPRIRVLKFSNTGVTDKRVVLERSEQSIKSKMVASMVINYLLSNGISVEIIDKMESVKAYKIKRNRNNEIVFEYKLNDPMDDSFMNLLNKTLEEK